MSETRVTAAVFCLANIWPAKAKAKAKAAKKQQMLLSALIISFVYVYVFVYFLFNVSLSAFMMRAMLQHNLILFIISFLFLCISYQVNAQGTNNNSYQ